MQCSFDLRPLGYRVGAGSSRAVGLPHSPPCRATPRDVTVQIADRLSLQQVRTRSASVQRYSRCHQVLMQGSVDLGLRGNRWTILRQITGYETWIRRALSALDSVPLTVHILPPGRIRFDRQRIPAVLTDEYRNRRASCTSRSTSTEHLIPYTSLDTAATDMNFSSFGSPAVSSVVLWRLWGSTRLCRQRPLSSLEPFSRSRQYQSSHRAMALVINGPAGAVSAEHQRAASWDCIS